ncbi:fructosamine kinase family protein [Halobacillus sp. H74]|uniref:fructosamine kinase family protein n=1 Tax=Halobacillus sp. H74 TaxID=3457436 RepID=UPI003FCDDFF0
METFIRETLDKLGDSSSIITSKHVTGGDINQTFYVKTESQPYFIKINENVPPHFFRAEAKGLEIIRNSQTIEVPDVYHFDEPQNSEKAALAMEWIETGTSASNDLLGQQVAQMHKQTTDKFGFHGPTFVGELDQPNEWCDSWTEYYARFRLLQQTEVGVANGMIGKQRRIHLEKLIDRLDNWIPSKPNASLLHGDLWGGNWMADSSGTPLLIDPSVLYGDHAFELAFTELFGGFSQSFYDHYKEVFPLPDYYEDTKPLYQLFYLLVHLNIFGEPYGKSVDRILKRYI